MPHNRTHPAEEERVARLARIGVLNAEAEPAFDHVCALARHIAATPIAAVSFLDADRVWCKARLGLEFANCRREHAFSRHAQDSAEVLWVEDALEDPRYRDDPCVVGEPRYRFFAAAPVTSTTGERVGTVCVLDYQPRSYDSIVAEQLRSLAALVSDEVELRALQGELREALRQKDEALAAQNRLLSVVSHELKTPLNGALGAASVLARTARGTSSKELAGVVDDSCTRLNALLDSLIAFASVQDEDLRLSEERFDPGAAVSQALALLTPAARRRRVTLVRSEPVRLPEGLGDRVRFGQLVFNLVSHAIEAVEATALQLETVWPAGEDLAFTVTVPAGAMVRPNDPSSPFGAGPINVGPGGLALGLATAQRIALAMGGQVHVADTPDGGLKLSARVKTRQATGEGGDLAETTGGRALIVDDNRTNLLVQSRMLQALGYDCRTCESGEEALDAAARERFDLVLMDINMPGLDGYQTTERLRRMAGWAAEVPVVAVSASLPPSGRFAELPSGLDAWLSKPLDVAKLAGCLTGLSRAADARAIWRLTYVSRPTPGCDTRAAIQDVLVSSQTRNGRDRITGALVLFAGRYVQTLEGPRDKVEATFARIAADRRHHDVVLVASGAAKARRYAGWAMIGADLTGSDMTPASSASDASDLTAVGEDKLLFILDAVKPKVLERPHA